MLFRCFAVIALGLAGCASQPALPPETKVTQAATPVTDRAELERMARDLGCPVEQIKAYRNTNTLAEGCGKRAAYSRSPDGQWELMMPVGPPDSVGDPTRHGTTAPRLEDAYAPQFERTLASSALKGRVAIRCRIELSGELTQCEPLEPGPSNPDALALAKQLEDLRMKPSTLEGHPVTTRFVFVFNLRQRN